MQRHTDEGGNEYRVVSLSTFLTVIGILASACAATGGWALGARNERNAFIDRMDDKYEMRLAAEGVHRGLADRIADTNIEIGRVRGRFEAHVDASVRAR